MYAETAVSQVSTQSPVERCANYTGVSPTKILSIFNAWDKKEEILLASGKRGQYERMHWSRNWISDIEQIIGDLNERGEVVIIKISGFILMTGSKNMDSGL